jgi:ribonuclease P protein component
MHIDNENKKYGLPASDRIKKRAEIGMLFLKGKRWKKGGLSCIYLIEKQNTDQGSVRAGFSVSKKLFKKAVDRNKIKRLMREAYRLQINPIRQLTVEKKQNCNCFFIFNEKKIPKFSEVYLNMQEWIIFMETKLKK